MTNLTKDDLIDKLDREVENLTDEGYKPVRGRALSENLEKINFRTMLYNMPMSDEMIEALCAKDNVLDELYKMALSTDEINDYFDFVADYAANAEHEHVANKLYGRLADEYNEYIDGVKKLPPEKIIDEAYKITMSSDIKFSFDDCSKFSTEQLKAIMSLENPLWELYQEWQDRDCTYMDSITEMIEEVADNHIENSEENTFEIGDYAIEGEAEDGQEP